MVKDTPGKREECNVLGQEKPNAKAIATNAKNQINSTLSGFGIIEYFSSLI